MVLEQKEAAQTGVGAALRELGLRLCDCRLRRNITQRNVAKAIGVSLPTYRKLEKGDGTVPTRLLAKALVLFGCIDRLPDLLHPAPVAGEREFPAPRRRRARERLRMAAGEKAVAPTSRPGAGED